MCTDNELRTKIKLYAEYSNQVAELEKLRKKLSSEIVSEMDNRQTLKFDGHKIVTERLYETPDREKLKTLLGNEYNKYCKVSISRYVNNAAAKKFM